MAQILHPFTQDEKDLAGILILDRAYNRLASYNDGGKLLLDLRSALNQSERRSNISPMCLGWLLELAGASGGHIGIKDVAA